MTLETQITKARFLGNGLAREWPLPFPVLKPEHVYLVETDEATGTETAVHPRRYEINECGTASVGVTYPASHEEPPLSVGTALTIYRLVPHVQETDLQNGAAFDSEVIESAFDHIVMQIQQLREELDRTIRVTIGGDKTPEELLAELLRAAEAALKAEEAAERAEKAADLAELKSYVKNIRRTWRAAADIPEGGSLPLPGPYYPGRDMLLLMYKGVVCAPKGGLASSGTPQYEEVGDPALDVPSYEVKVHFPVRAGEEFSQWVVASNAYRVNEEVAAMRDEARTEAGRAAAEAAIAASSSAAASVSEEAAEAARNAAESAAREADEKADAIMNLTTAAATLPPGEAATAAYDVETGVISFGIPEGQRGERGAGLQLKGVAAAPADLPVQGEEGDAYLVGDETEGFSLYVWNIATATWENGGSLGVRLSDSVTSDLSTVGASSKAVKTAYDKALEAKNAIPDLSDSVTTTSPDIAASATAVKTAYEAALAARFSRLPQYVTAGELDSRSALPGGIYAVDGDLAQSLGMPRAPFTVIHLPITGEENGGASQLFIPHSSALPWRKVFYRVVQANGAWSPVVELADVSQTLDRGGATTPYLMTADEANVNLASGVYIGTPEAAGALGMPALWYTVFVERILLSGGIYQGRQTWTDVQGEGGVWVRVVDSYTNQWRAPYKLCDAAGQETSKMVDIASINSASLKSGLYRVDNNAGQIPALPGGWYHVRQINADGWAHQRWNNWWNLYAAYERQRNADNTKWTDFHTVTFATSGHYAPMPRVAGVGQFYSAGTAAGNPVLPLPSGGSYAYFLLGMTAGNTIMGTTASVASGGTNVTITGANSVTGLIWRLA